MARPIWLSGVERITLNRITPNIRKVSRTATHYPAVIVDSHGGKASARLSTNGATVHNLDVIGGPVDIGDSVIVDYTTPDPTIIATSKSWLTQEDLDRALAGIQEPIPEEPLYEINKWMVMTLDDAASLYISKNVNWRGWADAVYYECWERWINDVGWPDITVRWPPGILSDPTDEHMDELYAGGVPVSHIGDAHNPTIFNFAMADQLTGVRYENISFRAVATYYYLTGYNFYFWAIEKSFTEYQRFNAITSGSNSPNYEEGFECIFRNCEFFSEVYPDPYELQPHEINDGTPYANIWISSMDNGEDYELYFYNCKFHARCNPEATITPHAIFYDGETVQDDMYVYLYNCYIDCGPQPFSNEDWFTMDEGYGGNFGHLHVYAYNCKFVDLDGSPIDPSTIENLTILDDGDRSVVNHIHTSGSSGGYDSYAIHTNVAGEW